jgi:putative flippase GtrA
MSKVGAVRANYPFVCQRTARNMRYGPALRYLAFGIVSNIILLVVFWITVWGGIAPELATAVLYVVGIVVSYFGHRSYSFRSTEPHRIAIPAYVMIHCVGIAVVVAAQAIFSRAIGLNPVAVQLAATALVTVFLFVMLQRVVFRGGRS